jgi:4-hydroxybutyryl-CoA dehydratase/vinylacetyl-CoA-Delta-isomerase
MLSQVAWRVLVLHALQTGNAERLTRWAQSLTLPSEQDYNNPETHELLKKYLKGKPNVPTEDRFRMFRLIENMTLGRNAVGYLTESMHGAGSPQAQRIQIARLMQLEYKKRLAKVLAGIEVTDTEAVVEEAGSYFGRVFEI